MFLPRKTLSLGLSSSLRKLCSTRYRLMSSQAFKSQQMLPRSSSFTIWPLSADMETKLNEKQSIDLGSGSEIIYFPNFFTPEMSTIVFNYLDKELPWVRPELTFDNQEPRTQPRDTCYFADDGMPTYHYNGYQPHPLKWEYFPPLQELLLLVHNALPGTTFNSLLLNRYKSGSDSVSWHADDNELYGPTPEIASLSFGCTREFLLKKKKQRNLEVDGCNVLKKEEKEKSFVLEHGSMLVMKGNTQRDWLHSLPKNKNVEDSRINLTFRRIYI